MKNTIFFILFIVIAIISSCTKELTYVSSNIDDTGFIGNDVNIKMTEAGSLRKVLVEKSIPFANIFSLTISGPINGSDLKVIRELAGADSLGNETGGHLEKLDISKASFVSGGEAHFIYEGKIPCKLVEDNTIPVYCFGYCKLKEITLPNNIRKFGSQSFIYCDSLQKINIPTSLETISPASFAYCTSLSVPISIPEKITKIDNYVFYYCKSIPQLNLPNIKAVGKYSFAGCWSAKFNENDLSNIISVEEYAFYQCHELTQAIIPKNTTIIPNGVFVNCSSIKSVDLKGIKTIGDRAFEGCINLKLSEIPEGIDTIGVSAFERVNISGKLVLPKSLKFAGAYAFNHVKIESLEINSDIQTSPGTSNATFYNCPNLKSVKVNEGCTALKLSFAYCKQLTDVSLPTSLDSIGQATQLPESVFSRCTALSHIDLPNNLKYIGYGTFEKCTNLKEVIIPASVTEIGSYAFNGCTGLSSLKLSLQLKKIPVGMLEDCTSLTSLIIPESVQYINQEAFRGSGLTTLKLPNTVKEIGYRAFYECKQLKDIYLSSNLTLIGTQAFQNCPLLYETNFPSSLKDIGYEAFSGCSALATIDVDTDCRLQNIPNYCFYQCIALTNFEIPTVVTELGDYAFSISGLSHIKIPASVRTIGNGCFSYCDKLVSVENHAKTPQQINSSVFTNVQLKNVKLTVPQVSISLYKSANIWKSFGTISVL